MEYTPSNDFTDCLTAEEHHAFQSMDADQIGDYLAAQESFEAMKAYAENPDTPAIARALLDFSVWVDTSDPSEPSDA